MRMKSSILAELGVILTLLFSSCSYKSSEKEIAPDLMDEADEAIVYSQFVDSLKYIPLETTSACLISSITDVQISEEFVFVFDENMQTVWIFSKEGKYLNHIYHHGDAPGEYHNICQFEYDSVNHQIVVLDMWTRSLLFYSLAGDFKKKVELEVDASDFKLIPSGGFVVSLAGADSPKAGIYYMDDSGRVIKKLVERNPNHLVYIDSNWELCAVSNKVCFMAPNFDNTSYCFDGQNLETSYAFHIKPDLKHVYKEDVSLQHMEDFLRTEYIESKDWIYATYWSAVADVRCFLYSKKTQKYYIGKSLKNDLDGMQCQGKTSMSEGDTFVFWCESENEEQNPVLQILYLKH